MSKFYKIKAPTKRESRVIKLMVFVGIIAIINFLYHFFQPNYKGHSLLYYLLSITLLYGIYKILYMWYHYINISIPNPPLNSKKFKVDIFTTFFPGEPYEMIVATLEAIQKIKYPHTTYLCDEANDPYLIKVCKRLGVKHVSRDNRIHAKAGNINNALQFATGEICVILDPDHVPEPDFLDPIIPHFNRPEIGFVQIVQSYYNLRESLVAKGAAEQTFQFYGPMMMSMNSYGTVNAIGANCTFRRAALDSIGGHAPGLSEDMHTAMLLYAKGWKSVYVPQVLAKGLAPSNLISFYKQQLKWSRGTFELLYSVYPKIFNHLTIRQKIHYLLSPLHYLIGLIYFINFLIPILALVLSRSPWEGDLLIFILNAAPIIVCAVLIRAYIQKWVIEKKERGFHFIGGLLQITTWWVYSLGFIYTLFRKKIPYLPTPKEDSEQSSPLLILPNVLIGFASLFAIVFGIQRDLTPYSIVMALFCLINAFFMFFSVYLASRVTNKNRILRTVLQKNIVAVLVQLKQFSKSTSGVLFKLTRIIAFPLLIISFVVAQFGLKKIEQGTWENVKPSYFEPRSEQYLGIFHPADTNGRSDLNQILKIEKEQHINFDIISTYIPWGDRTIDSFPSNEVEAILNKKAIPMITWEPWSSNFKIADTIPKLRLEKNILPYITQGFFDNYIDSFALHLKSYQKPIFLRFAHEFDNPNYPWSSKTTLRAEQYKLAWIYIHSRFQKLKATNVVWVWNPWKSSSMASYYPGQNYVDWIGITGLNYGSLNEKGRSVSFKDLYHPFHEEVKRYPNKPVMISEFGSLQLGVDQKQWLKEALASIDSEFKEINAIVFFNSGFDKNIPQHSNKNLRYLNWKLPSFSFIESAYPHRIPPYFFSTDLSTNNAKRKITGLQVLPKKVIKGVGYKKGQNWKANHYVLSRQELERDFILMKRAGINHIRYQGGFYDTNVINISKTNGIDILYNFWIPDTLDHLYNKTQQEALKKSISKTIHKLKKHSNIKAWVLGNKTLESISKTVHAPKNYYQKEAYFKWLKFLLIALKEIDPKRPLILEITASSENFNFFEELIELNLPLDYFGFKVIINEDYLQFKRKAEKHKIPFIIADISSENLRKLSSKNKTKHSIIGNWQDQWENNKITFDGLLDRKGRTKKNYWWLHSFWSSKKETFTPKINILAPAVLMYPNKKVTFNALIQDNNQWIYPSHKHTAEQFEWVLVKQDLYGNSIALKHLGNGNRITFKVPKDLSLEIQYQILLSYAFDEDKNVVTRRIPIKTPLNTSVSANIK